MNILSLHDIDVTGKRVLVRVDFNVPLDEKGDIMDDNRIKAALPTITYLVERQARVVLCSHFGRPDGRVVEGLRLGVVAERLTKLLGKKVTAARDCIGPEVEQAVARMKGGDVLLLENLRFHAEEEKNDDAFARSLAKLADIYVDDAFGTAHRAHASVVGVTKYLPSVAGLLMEKEIKALGGILENPAHPYCGLLGGAKISDKVSMLENILGRVDCLMIGGGMAATFLKAQSLEIGKSLVETDMLGTATELMKKAADKGANIYLPVDVVVADDISDSARMVETVSIRNVAPDMKIADIGPETVKLFQKQLSSSKTVFWNGPMGVYEVSRFAAGTKEMAETLAKINASTVIGGGSTADVVNELGLADKMYFVSTGGGASLRFLSGKTLPGVEALRRKPEKQ
jgi:phosphoglycerate kinase